MPQCAIAQRLTQAPQQAPDAQPPGASHTPLLTGTSRRKGTEQGRLDPPIPCCVYPVVCVSCCVIIICSSAVPCGCSQLLLSLVFPVVVLYSVPVSVGAIDRVGFGPGGAGKAAPRRYALDTS